MMLLNDAFLTPIGHSHLFCTALQIEKCYRALWNGSERKRLCMMTGSMVSKRRRLFCAQCFRWKQFLCRALGMWGRTTGARLCGRHSTRTYASILQTLGGGVCHISKWWVIWTTRGTERSRPRMHGSRTSWCRGPGDGTLVCCSSGVRGWSTESCLVAGAE